ncbi:alanine racemase [Jatrophihabitans sp. DSM 45814]
MSTFTTATATTTTPGDWLVEAARLAPDTPCLMISEERTRANVTRVAEESAAHGKRLRPHTKTHKMIEIANMQLEAGAAGLQVAKLGEAEVMARTGVADLLVAFPVVGQPKLDRLMALAARTSVSVSLDRLEVAQGISDAVSRVVGASDEVAQAREIDILLEIETGLQRVGAELSAVPGLASDIRRLPGLRLVGVLTHEGHVLKRATSDDERAAMTDQAAGIMVRAAEQLEAAGVPDPLISMGSTPTWRYLLEIPEVAEVRPGGYVFYDMNSVAVGAASSKDLAAVVVATVVSVSAKRGECVLDAGSKSLSIEGRTLEFHEREGTDRSGRDESSQLVSFGYLPELQSHVVRVSEEHSVVACSQSVPAIGERFAVVPNHICPVVNLFDDATVLSTVGGLVSWQVAARGKVR